ncbi:MAG: hypothetical protein ACLT29_03150 [Ruminococcus callidus]
MDTTAVQRRHSDQLHQFQTSHAGTSQKSTSPQQRLLCQGKQAVCSG